MDLKCIIIGLVLGMRIVCGAGEWQPSESNPVLTKGSLLNISSPAIVFDGENYTLYFGGYWGAQEIFKADSKDGIHFTRQQPPAIARDTPGAKDAWNVIGSPCILKDGDTYHAWFAGTPNWDTPTAIGYASSPDGVNWSKYPGNKILDEGNGGSANSPRVIKDGEIFKMWFLKTAKGSWKPRIYYAESDNMTDWKEHSAPVMEGNASFGGELITSLWVVKDQNRYRMWYGVIGTDQKSYIGEAVSVNGLNWERADRTLLPGNDPTVILQDGKVKMWYTIGNKEAVGCAQKEDSLPATPAASAVPAAGTTPAADTAAIKPVEQSDDSPFGINCFQFPARERELGVKWLRLEFCWNTTEPEKGKFDWQKYDTVVAAAKAQNIRIMGLLAGTAKWASSRPEAADFYTYPPTDMTALADFVFAMVSRYKGEIKCWEIWNEPDLPYAWNGTHAQFVEVMKTVYEAVKRADPDATVTAMALSGGFASFLDQVLSLGGGNYFDVYTDHTYVSGQALHSRIGTVKSVMAKHNAVKPIWVTETGCNSRIEKRENESAAEENARWSSALQTQAQEVVKQHVGLLSEGVERIFTYQASRVGSRYADENWGLTDENGRVLPSGIAYNVMVNQLAGKKFVTPLKYGQFTRGYAFADDRSAVICLWGEKDEKIKINLGDSRFEITDLNGEPLKPQLKDGFVELDVTANPIWIGALERKVLDCQQCFSFAANDIALVANQEQTVDLQLSNPFQVPCTVKLSVWAPPGVTAKLTQKSADLKPGEKITLPVTVILKAKSQNSLRILANADYNNGFFKAGAQINAQAVEAAQIRVKPVRIAGNGVMELAVEVKNISGQSIDGDLTLSADFAAKFSPEKLTVTNLAGNAGQSYRVTLNTQAGINNFNSVNISGRFTNGDQVEKSLPMNFILCPEGALKTDFSWANLNTQNQFVPVINGAKWGGADDLGGKIFSAWDQNALYLTVVVKDDTFWQPNSVTGPLFDGDSVQIAFDTAMNRSVNYDNDDYEMCFALTPQGAGFSVFVAPGGMALKNEATLKMEAKNGTLTYQITLPWRSLGLKPQTGTRFGVSVLVNDNDKSGRKGFLQWTGGIGGRKNPQLFGTMILLEK